MAKKTAKYAFIAGVLIAIVVGIAGPQIGPNLIWFTSFIVLMGIVVGCLNISPKETKDFLLMSTVLVVASYAGGASGIFLGVQFIGNYLSGVFSAILAFVVPAAIAAALRGVWTLGSD